MKEPNTLIYSQKKFMFLISIHKAEKSDAELLAAFQKEGDTSALGLLYDRYLHLVYGLCLKYLKDRDLAKDATMDIYEAISVKLAKHPVTYFKSWLYMVSKNHCLMKLRKVNLEISDDIFMESEPQEHPNEGTTLDENLDALEHCMEKLKQEQERCIRLFYLEGKSYQEVAGLENLGLNEVKSHIQNAKRNLKLCMEKHVEA